MIACKMLQLVKTRWLHNWFFTRLYYFKEHYKLIGINLSKQQALDADPKVIQQINFTGNLEQAECATIFFTIEEAKKTTLGVLQGNMRVF